MSDCKEIAQQLSDYIDGELDAGLCAELEAHLAGCKNCRLMVDNLRMTVKLCRDGSCEDLPDALQKKLNAKLEERWRAKFGKK